MSKLCADSNCEQKGDFQPFDNFYKRSANKYSARCKPCQIKRMRTAIKEKSKPLPRMEPAALSKNELICHEAFKVANG